MYPSAKFRWIVDFLESNPNDKTIVFCSLRSTITYLAKHLRDQGIEVAVLVGGNSSSQSDMLRRYKTITHDSDGKICNVMLITCDKGVGLNLQITKHVIFESKPYLQTLVEQNIFRAVREFGLNDIVNVYHLMTTFQDGAPTVDHYVQAILDKKAKTGAIFGANHVKPLILHVAKTETEGLEEMREKYSKLN